MPARFYTIAVRGMHYGRYGAGGEDSRLMPLFIGYPEFVRGYGVNSFSSGECASSTSCPTFDRLVGSRMLVGNIEFRFPLLRPFGVSDRMYGPLPVEVAFFLDGGVTWNRGQKPSFLNGTREPVSSGGVTLRANLLGLRWRRSTMQDRSIGRGVDGFGASRSRLDSESRRRSRGGGRTVSESRWYSATSYLPTDATS